MAEAAIVLAFLQVLVTNLSNAVLEDLKLAFESEDQLNKLRDILSSIRAVLNGAEERQQNPGAIKWLNELRDVAYDANDVIDEAATEVQRCQLIKLASVRNSLSPFNPKRTLFRVEISRKARSIVDRLESIGRTWANVGLSLWAGSSHQEEHDATTSLSPLSVLGREYDKRKLIELLCPSDKLADAEISVIPILGMVGLGKTTLAQIVYNEKTVESSFDLRMWVHVSSVFNVEKVTKAILESILDSHLHNATNLDILQKHLQKNLRGKRYLLVLDDVWAENTQKWEGFMRPLLYGAKGSKILVTTRSEEVADVMGTTLPYRLRGISEGDCWKLFCQYAWDRYPHQHNDPSNIQAEIVRKCKGLPLAAIALGKRLRKEADRRNWSSILRNEEWEFSGTNRDILRAVDLSYQQLPIHLKPCFAYCSLLPKGFEFEKEFMVQLWMAQNFIQPRRGERTEDIGGRYFDSLMQKSFFQYSRFDYKGCRHRYTMHDLTHGFAEHVSAEECRIVELGKPSNLSAKTRHVTLMYDQSLQNDSTQSPSSNQNSSIFETLYACKGLYTLLVSGFSISERRVVDDLVKSFPSLRTLDLSNSGLIMLPESIGDLKHLRCLVLRSTSITRLPESVSHLYNLETLDLRNCYDLEELPKHSKNLHKLRHLDLRLDDDLMVVGMCTSGKLRSMPEGIGQLTDLQTLSRFVIGPNGCRVRELKDMNDLSGELIISNLYLVSHAAEAEANLTSKQHIQRLELRWSCDGIIPSHSHGAGVPERVLENLQPHADLRGLMITGYGGTSFPRWMGHPSYSNLVTFWLFDCKHCEMLPPLGQLPALKNLYIKGMDKVKTINCSFCGHGERNFPCLEKLHFENMQSLHKWLGDDDCILSSLRELVVMNCFNLEQLSHNLPSLTKLKIDGSPKLTGLRRLPKLQSLELRRSDEWIWDSWPGLTALSSLHRLEISHCDRLISLVDYCLPSGLNYFGIKHCPNLLLPPEKLWNLKDLEDLEIQNCSNLTKLPDGLKYLQSLVRLEISDCLRLESLPSDGLPTNLHFLSIDNCPELTKRCQDWRSQDWLKLQHISLVWMNKKLVSSIQPQHKSYSKRLPYEGQSSRK